jgi:S-adenosylmethionine-dependent methyltransferase
MGAGEVDVELPAASQARAVAAFDANAEAWEEYTHTPLGHLRQELALHRVATHLERCPVPLQILDAGGGTGSTAIPLARRGHHVWLLDFSPRMLDLARQKLQVENPPLPGRLALCQGRVEDAPGLLEPRRFDLVVCHMLLEFVPERGPVLHAMAEALRPGGMISVVLFNPQSEPLRWLLSQGDPRRALDSLRGDASSADLFGLPQRRCTAAQLWAELASEGVDPMAEYGIRVFADYVPSHSFSDPAFAAQLWDLELAAGSMAPYKGIARYSHLLGQKRPSP